MIGIRGLSRRFLDHQQRLAGLDHYLAPTDFRACDESMKGPQCSQLVVLRVNSLDAFDRGLERERQASLLQRVYWRIFSPSFSSKLVAREVVNGIPQLHRIAFEGLNDAGKTHRKVTLRCPRKGLSPANFLRFRAHLTTRGAIGARPQRDGRAPFPASPVHPKMLRNADMYHLMRIQPRNCAATATPRRSGRDCPVVWLICHAGARPCLPFCSVFVEGWPSMFRACVELFSVPH